MSYSVPLEHQTPQPYTLKVLHSLFSMGAIHGIQPDAMVEFFAAQVQNMINCPPNVAVGPQARIWVLRGFYPNTPLFFKLVVWSSVHNNVYGARASSLVVKNRRGWELATTFNGQSLNERMVDSMENELLGAKHKIEPLFTKKFHLPKCMSPKGMRLLRYKKPSKRSKKSEN